MMGERAIKKQKGEEEEENRKWRGTIIRYLMNNPLRLLLRSGGLLRLNLERCMNLLNLHTWRRRTEDDLYRLLIRHDFNYLRLHRLWLISILQWCHFDHPIILILHYRLHLLADRWAIGAICRHWEHFIHRFATPTAAILLLGDRLCRLWHSRSERFHKVVLAILRATIARLAHLHLAVEVAGQ